MFFSSAVFKLESADTCCERSNKSAQTIVTRAICSIPDKRPTFGLDDDDVGHVVLRRERSYGVYQLGRETPVNELLRHMDATRRAHLFPTGGDRDQARLTGALALLQLCDVRLAFLVLSCIMTHSTKEGVFAKELYP